MEGAGQGNGLGTSEAIVLRGNCSELPSLGKPRSLPCKWNHIFGIGTRGSRLESLLILSSLIASEPQKCPSMSSASNVSSGPDKDVLLASAHGLTQQAEALSAGISMQPHQAPRIQFRMNSLSLSLFPPPWPSHVA